MRKQNNGKKQQKKV